MCIICYFVDKIYFSFNFKMSINELRHPVTVSFVKHENSLVILPKQPIYTSLFVKHLFSYIQKYHFVHYYYYYYFCLISFYFYAFLWLFNNFSFKKYLFN